MSEHHPRPRTHNLSYAHSTFLILFNPCPGEKATTSSWLTQIQAVKVRGKLRIPSYLGSPQPRSPDHPRLNPFLWSISQQERINSGTEKACMKKSYEPRKKKIINFLKEHKEILKSLYRRKKSKISQGQNRMSGPKAHRRTLWCWQ